MQGRAVAEAKRETEEVGRTEWRGEEEAGCEAVSKELARVSGGRGPGTERGDAAEVRVGRFVGSFRKMLASEPLRLRLKGLNKNAKSKTNKQKPELFEFLRYPQRCRGEGDLPRVALGDLRSGSEPIFSAEAQRQGVSWPRVHSHEGRLQNPAQGLPRPCSLVHRREAEEQ